MDLITSLCVPLCACLYESVCVGGWVDGNASVKAPHKSGPGADNG